MRLFIAVNFDNDSKKRIVAAQDRIRGEAEKGKFSSPENLHLTVVFLGETPEERLPAIKEAMTRAVSADGKPGPAFCMVFSKAGFFRRAGKELWYLAPVAEKNLKELQARLAGELLARGFSIDTRPYNAHITLGREVRNGPKPFTIEGISIPVKRISLMLSENVREAGGKTRLVYTELFGVDL